MREDDLAVARRESEAFYDAVFRAHGARRERSDGAAWSLDRPPPLFSSLVTRSRSWQPDADLERVSARAERDGWPPWSVQDSFAALDLLPQGFERLFDARWIHRAPTAAPVPAPRTDVTWARCSDSRSLAAWRAGWDANEEGVRASEIYVDALLGDADFAFVLGRRAGTVVGGALLHTTWESVGISNVFGVGGRTVDSRALVGFAAATFPGRALVAYEREETARALSPLGFDVVGSLTVWRHRRRDARGRGA